MNEMRVASIELAAYFVSSDDRRSITSMRSVVRVNGAYSARSVSTARLSSAPMTTRSGFMKSLTASPSLRNSGFDATANSCFACFLTIASILSPVPTGTVDLVTSTAQPGERLGDLLGGLEDERQVGGPVGPGRRSDRQQDHLGARDAARDVGREQSGGPRRRCA